MSSLATIMPAATGATPLGRPPSVNVDVDQAAALWQHGCSATTVAEFLGCTKGAVMGMVGRHRDAFPPRRARTNPEPSAEVIDQAVSLWAAGLMPDEIAAKLGLGGAAGFRNMRERHPDRFPKRSTRPRSAGAPVAARAKPAAPAASVAPNRPAPASRVEPDEPEDGESEARPPRSECFRPLRGVAPVLLANCKGCSWPVQETDPLVMSTLFQCSAPLAPPAPGKPPYCQAHRDLARRSNTPVARVIPRASQYARLAV